MQHSHVLLRKGAGYSTLVREKGVSRGDEPFDTLLRVFMREKAGSHHTTYHPSAAWHSQLNISYGSASH